MILEEIRTNSKYKFLCDSLFMCNPMLILVLLYLMHLFALTKSNTCFGIDQGKCYLEQQQFTPFIHSIERWEKDLMYFVKTQITSFYIFQFVDSIQQCVCFSILSGQSIGPLSLIAQALIEYRPHLSIYFEKVLLQVLPLSKYIHSVLM